MKRSILINMVIVAMISILGVIFLTDLPFYKLALILIASSILLLSFSSIQYLFPIIISVILGFGAFLTGYAFLAAHQENIQIELMYIHLLLTAFLLLYWVLVHYLKKTVNESNQLYEKVKSLEKYDVTTKLLTTHEFLDQSKIVQKGAARRNESLWLLVLELNHEKKTTLATLKHKLSQIVFSSIREEYDFVTATNKGILILVQNTNENGVEVVLQRIHSKSHTVFNQIRPPYQYKCLEIISIQQIIEEVEEKK
ncbi:hypothetical protein [Cytobacillus gottheilii]|uniref:hypothetical protein n=1 Tax=Cytobacillus gottheilii TaxID=859144 RepID=UPI0009BAC754|nr:hypothetical protein [Cytobacillus gottheilii]